MAQRRPRSVRKRQGGAPGGELLRLLRLLRLLLLLDEKTQLTLLLFILSGRELKLRRAGGKGGSRLACGKNTRQCGGKGGNGNEEEDLRGRVLDDGRRTRMQSVSSVRQELRELYALWSKRIALPLVFVAAGEFPGRVWSGVRCCN